MSHCYCNKIKKRLLLFKGLFYKIFDCNKICMGNLLVSTSEVSKPPRMENYTPVKEFKFQGPFEEDAVNGSCFNGIYIPEEIIEDILSYIPSTSLLNLSLVCKKWCNIIKSETFWIHRYNQLYPNRGKKLPWYVYYSYFTTNNFTNLIKNGNGEQKFDHWIIIKNYGDKFRIENPPQGADLLPSGVRDFNGQTSCFATSFYECNKIQLISLENKRLLRYIINEFSPNICASEWFAGRFDCGCHYKMALLGYDADPGASGDLEYFPIKMDGRLSDTPEEDEIIPALFNRSEEREVEQWMGKHWEKVEITVNEYSKSVNLLVFAHEGRDTQFWKGHYGSKMAGAVVKFDFESIQPIEENRN